MFESAELGQRVSRAAYQRALPKLRESLLEAQRAVRLARRFPVVVIVSGFDASGRGETVNTLLEWMDPRFIRTHAFRAPTPEEAARPPLWRYWRSLPARGEVAIYFAGWYGQPIRGFAQGELSRNSFERQLAEIRQLEQQLASEGALVLKFWLHLSRKDQRRRLEKLDRDKATRWRVSKGDWQRHENYARWRSAADLALRATSTAEAPWMVLDARDERFRHLSFGRLLRDALQKRLRQKSPPRPAMPPLGNGFAHGRSLLGELDLTQRLGHKAYAQKLEHYQGQLALLTRRKRFREHGLIAVFEGTDASGKGGAIRRIAQSLDSRQVRTVPVAAPCGEEAAHPYLWRFWRELPARGEILLFDRSWYGRVLVERVEKLCSEHDWRRAYAEIAEFEEELVRHGFLLAKFYLHISPEEQLRRLRERQRIGYKHFKVSPADWRAQRQRRQYDQAVCDMVERTSTEIAPWILVEAEDKRHARIKVLRSLCELIESSTE